MIEFCFDMLKSSEHEVSWHYSNLNPPIFKIVLKFDQTIPRFHFTDSKNREACNEMRGNR